MRRVDANSRNHVIADRAVLANHVIATTRQMSRHWEGIRRLLDSLVRSQTSGFAIYYATFS